MKTIPTFSPETNKCLFVVPERFPLASTQVRVLQFLPLLHSRGILTTVFPYRGPLETRRLKLVRSLPHAGSLLARSVLWPFIVAERKIRLAVLLSSAKSSDVVFVQKALLDSQSLLKLRAASRRLIFDIDDAVFLRHPIPLSEVGNVADLVICGNSFIQSFFEKLKSRTMVVPSSIDLKRFSHGPSIIAEHTTPIIGWIGGHDTSGALAIVRETLLRLRVQFDFRVRLVGARRRDFECKYWNGLNLEFIEKYSDADIPALLESFTVGIMPLPSDDTSRGKCAYKALLYMAAGVPSVSSNVGEISKIVSNGTNGFLAESEDDWTTALTLLLSNSQLRQNIISEASKTITKFAQTVAFESIFDACFVNSTSIPK